MIKLLLSDAVISLPTFIIAECVLIYLDPDSSRAIVGWASKTFPTAIFFLYEQVGHMLNLKPSIPLVFSFLSFVYFSVASLWFHLFLVMLLAYVVSVFVHHVAVSIFNRFIQMMLLVSK